MKTIILRLLSILLICAALSAIVSCAARNDEPLSSAAAFTPAASMRAIPAEELPDVSVSSDGSSAAETPALSGGETVSAPSTETPSTETPVTEPPTTETPTTETPVTETPSTETPTTETPSTETPSTETPLTETPLTETPPTETPATETPSVETPVSLPKPYTPFYPEEKVVAVTFDDGPDRWTGELLDVIEGTDDRITFFVTGYMMDRSKDFEVPYAEYTKRALDMGCEVGIHCYYHEDVVYSSKNKTDCTEEVFKREILDLDEKYRSMFGVSPRLFRPMGGNYNPTRDYGYTLIMWSVDSYDWRTFDNYRKEGLLSEDPEIKKTVTKTAVDEIVERVMRQVKSGDIILMHDIYYISRLAFEEIYGRLKAEGYRLVTVSELLGIDPSEHHGQYFYASYYYGEQGKNVNLGKQKTRIDALPKKREENCA